MDRKKTETACRGVGASAGGTQKCRARKNCKANHKGLTAFVARRVFVELRNDEGHLYGMESRA